MTVGAKLQEHLNASYTNLDVNISDIRIEEPPTDDSHTTRMELEELEHIVQEAKLPREIMRVADRDPLRLFYSVAKKKGVDPLEEEAKEWADDWTKLSFEFKLKFKRRRPWEVKKEHDIDFVVNKSDTTESPSYPSGHAMMGYGVAEFYKDKYPLMADEWDNVAEIIAHSRLQMGVHYPSDVEESKKIVDQLIDQVKEASIGSFVREGMKRTLQSGKGVKVTTQGGGKKVIGNTNRRYTMKKTTTPPTTSAPVTEAPTTPQTWGQKAKGWGNSISNWASDNPVHATGAAGVVGVGGVMGAKKLMQPKPTNQMPKFGSLDRIKPRSYEDLSKQASLPSLNNILKATESGLIKLKLPELADKVDLYRARRNLGQAVKDLHKYESITGRFGQMPRIVIPKSHLDVPDLYRLGFQDSLIAVPEIGQKTWTTYRHPLDKLHLHDHGKYLNLHIDSLPSLQMIAERNSLSAKARRKLMETIPEGITAWRPGKSKDRGFLKKLDDQVSGLGHAILEGGPGYINYALKQLNPWKVSMAEEVISKLPKDYLKKRYGIVKTSAEKLRLYHGSPLDLETLEPRQPNKGTWGDHGLYGTTNPLVAALYAIARNDSRGSWGILPDGRLIAKSKKELNPEGYVYAYDSDDYIPPPEDDPGIGYASQSSPEILSKEKVYLDNLRDSITRVDDRDKFLEFFKKTSSPRLRTTIFGVDPEGNLLHGFGGQGFYKFPGGGVDPGESIVDAAKRELLEEAGYDVESIEELPGLDTSDSVGATSAKGHMGHGSSLTKYLLARLGKRNESLLGSEGDAISNLQTAPIDEVLGGLEGDMLFGSGVAESNHAALSRVRDMLQKTSSEQPLLRHRSTLLIRDPETGKLLAANSREDRNFNDVSPFYFPGGGLYEDEYDTPRTPTEEEILEGARREALEELGMTLKNPRVIGNKAHILPQEWRDKALRKRGVPYEGGHEHLVLADKGDVDNSMYNVEGDAFTKGEYWDPQEVYDSLYEYGQSGGQFSDYNVQQAKAIKEHLLKKKASDLSVLTAVPTQNLDLIMRKGLYSQKAMLDDPEVMAAFLSQRNADKAWKNDEKYDEKRFREQYDKRLKLLKGRDASLAGPSVFFTDPDPDKVSDPRHFINQFNTQKLRVNLSKLLQDIPETRIQGSELIPSSAAENMSDEEFEQYVKDRRRDITPEEVAKYIATDPKELWKHYKDEYLGRYYAADVPHAHIRTPSGIIPPEYLEQVEKTSSAKDQLKHILITGQSGSGKTTEAKRLAAELDMPVVHLDEQKGFGPKGVDPDYIEDLTEATQGIISNLDKPHIVEGTQMLSEQFPLELLQSNDLRILEADEDELVKRLTERGWNTESGRDLKGPDSADEARHVVKHQRKSVDSLVERLKKKASLEDEFQPDLTPDDLKALGVYDQVYGDAPSEASMKEWPEHWINPQDPLGWLQWYGRYSEGRRTDDDERQMKRWKSFKARHLAQYLKKPTPRRAAALRNWGIDVEKY